MKLLLPPPPLSPHRGLLFPPRPTLPKVTQNNTFAGLPFHTSYCHRPRPLYPRQATFPTSSSSTFFFFFIFSASSFRSWDQGLAFFFLFFSSVYVVITILYLRALVYLALFFYPEHPLFFSPLPSSDPPSMHIPISSSSRLSAVLSAAETLLQSDL